MFSASCSPWGGWVGVVGGCTHTCAHAHMHMHTHACVVNMIISCKWPPHWGNPSEFPIMSYTCACVCMCMWVGCTLLPPPINIHPPPHPPRGDPRNHSKFNSTWTNRDISILFEDLKSVETPPCMGGCIIWWVGGLVVDGWGQVKSLKIWKLLTESR